MKKIFLLLTLIITIVSFSQEKTTDVLSVKAGLLGAWIGYEKALSSDATLIGEIGYEGGFSYSYSSTFGSELKYAFSTVFSLEGRFYHNFSKRIERGKNTMNNAANFLGLEISYAPDLGTIKGSENYEFQKAFSIIPKYGFRRNLSDKFNFEFSAGPGYQWTENGKDGIILGIEARFGFVF